MTLIAYMKNGYRKEWNHVIGVDEEVRRISDFTLKIIKVLPLGGQVSYIDTSKLERLVVKP